MKLWFLIGALFFALNASAHKPSDSYLYLNKDDQQITLQWDIALRDLDLQLALDSNANGDITWGELKRQQSEVVSYALERLNIHSGESKCTFQLDELLAAEHSDGGYAALKLSTVCHPSTSTLDIKYSLFFDVDPTHRGLLIVQSDDQPQTYILSPDQPALSLSDEKQSVLQVLGVFIKEGVWHIWIGLDHILFLLALLLPVVWQRRDRQWQPVNQFGPVARSTIATVTMFTVAHSITLWLAVMEYVQLPAQWVEVAIAATIIVTVLHNLFPIIKLKTWQIAFVFGLIHGFGFANVLSDLPLATSERVMALLSFNVGIELGQVVCILIFLPIALALRQTTFYRQVMLIGGSSLAVVIALLWMMQRLLGQQWIYG